MIKNYQFILNNGLKIHYLFNPRSLISFVQVWYNFGSFQEKKEKNGITHLLEHLYFKGTKEISGEEFSRIIQKEGGICNGFTSEEKVCFYETIPLEKTEMVLKMEGDRMQNLEITEEKFSSEKKVVLEEYKERIQNQPLATPLLKIKKEIFGDHPFSMDPAGNEETISNIKYEDVLQYYNDYFTPENSTLIIVSSFEFEYIKSLVEKYFGNIDKKGLPLQEIPPLCRPAVDYAEAKIPVKVNAFSLSYFLKKTEENYFPLTLLHNLIGGDEDSFLKKEVQEKKFYVLQAGTFPYFTKAGDLFIFYSLHLPFFKKYNFPEILKDFLEKKIENYLNNQKFEELKGRILIDLISSLHGTEKMGLYFANCIISRGNPEYFFKDYERIKNLKREEVMDTLKQLISSPSCKVFLKGSLWQKK